MKPLKGLSLKPLQSAITKKEPIGSFFTKIGEKPLPSVREGGCKSRLHKAYYYALVVRLMQHYTVDEEKKNAPQLI